MDPSHGACNACGLILSTNLTNLYQRTLLINIEKKTLKTHLLFFQILEVIFITTIDKTSWIYFAMLAILFFTHQGLIHFLLVGSCSKTSPANQGPFRDTMHHHCMQDIVTTLNQGESTKALLDEGCQREVVQLVKYQIGALSKRHHQYRQEGERNIESRIKPRSYPCPSGQVGDGLSPAASPTTLMLQWPCIMGFGHRHVTSNPDHKTE